MISAEPPSRPVLVQGLWIVGSVMAAASVAYFGILAGFFVFRQSTAAYCAGWVCWAATLFLTTRIGVFRIKSRRRLLGDALLYSLGSLIELIVWTNATNIFNNLDIFDSVLFFSALISSMVPTLLHVVFIFLYMRMIVFRRLLRGVGDPERGDS